MFPLFCWAHSFKTQAAKIIITKYIYRESELIYFIPTPNHVGSEKRGDATRGGILLSGLATWLSAFCLPLWQLCIACHIYTAGIYSYSHTFLIYLLCSGLHLLILPSLLLMPLMHAYKIKMFVCSFHTYKTCDVL